MARPARVTLGGVPVDSVDAREALDLMLEAAGSGRFHQAATVNADFLASAQSHPEVRRILAQTDLNVADGAPVLWLARLAGARLPERVAGADLVPQLMVRAAAAGLSVYLLGGEGGVAGRAAARLVDRLPALRIAGVEEPPRARVEDMDNEAIAGRIRASGADILLVALGHPKQERWIDLNRQRLSVGLALGVGCAFDLIAGRVTRAPGWMQRAGLEWLYRAGREPGRLVRRYVNDLGWLIAIAGDTLQTRWSIARSVPQETS